MFTTPNELTTLGSTVLLIMLGVNSVENVFSQQEALSGQNRGSQNTVLISESLIVLTLPEKFSQLHVGMPLLSKLHVCMESSCVGTALAGISGATSTAIASNMARRNNLEFSFKAILPLLAVLNIYSTII